MHFSIDSKALSAALSACGSASTRKTFLPILSTVLVVAGDGVVKVTQTNLDVEFEVSVPADVSIEGKTCVSSSALSSFVKSADGDITVIMDGGRVTISDGVAKLDLACADPADFHLFKVESVEEVWSGDPSTIASVISWVSLARAPESDSRRVAKSMCFDDGIVTCSDGKRIHCADVGGTFSRKITVACETTHALSAVLSGADHASWGVDGGILHIHAGAKRVALRMAEVEYPIGQVRSLLSGVARVGGMHINLTDLRSSLRRATSITAGLPGCSLRPSDGGIELVTRDAIQTLQQVIPGTTDRAWSADVTFVLNLIDGLDGEVDIDIAEGAVAFSKDGRRAFLARMINHAAGME